MRLSEVDQSSTPWVYRKRDHKNAWRGKPRNILIGPQARCILIPYVRLSESDGNDFLFSPIRSEKHRLESLRAKRKSKVQPSQISRKKPNPKRTLREHYDRSGYQHRIAIICKKHEIPHWHPNQLRHLVAETAQAQNGSIEHVCALLGDDVESVKIYAQRNLDLAKKLARENG